MAQLRAQTFKLRSLVRLGPRHERWPLLVVKSIAAGLPDRTYLVSHPWWDHGAGRLASLGNTHGAAHILNTSSLETRESDLFVSL